MEQVPLTRKTNGYDYIGSKPAKSIEMFYYTRSFDKLRAPIPRRRVERSNASVPLIKLSF